ncbi:MAG TPA: hypothetical protein VII33_12760 [Nakamurella sp.]
MSRWSGDHSHRRASPIGGHVYIEGILGLSVVGAGIRIRTGIRHGQLRSFNAELLFLGLRAVELAL